MRIFTRRWAVLSMWAALSLSGQEAPPSVKVGGSVKQTLTLTQADLAKLPRASVRLGSSGAETVYEGVWVYEVLRRAGVPLGGELRGKALASYVLARARDGYEVVFSLAELDPSFTDSQFLLADTVDGKPLASDQGPFRLVVPKDKPGARAIRMLTELEVVQLRK